VHSPVSRTRTIRAAPCSTNRASRRPQSLGARALAINTAWAWLRFQPKSQLARWYQTKFGKGNTRIRKIGIVALARKLSIAFWRYLDQGLLPEGAVLRA
jgi:transposase